MVPVILFYYILVQIML